MSTFIETLGELRKGTTLEELSTKLTVVVQAVRDTGKPGSLSFTLKVKPASKGDTGVLMLEDSITTKVPQLERGATVFFATKDNSLSTRDERQLELEGLRVVEMETKPLKEVV